MKIYLAVTAALLSFYIHSQNCSNKLVGKVVDFHDGSPIIDATVYIEALNSYKITDEQGRFQFNDLCEGEIELTISHLNCETKTFNVTIDGNTAKSFALEHHIQELQLIEVTGVTNKKLTTSAQESLLKEKTITKYSALSIGDALKEVPGVSSINTGNSIVKPMINGMHSSRVLIVNNGVRMQDQEWGIEHAPNIDVNTAGQISVIKGSGTLAFGGDAIGGVVVIKPSKMVTVDSLYGTTTVTGQSNGRGYNLNSSLTKTTAKGWYYNIQGNYKRNGDYRSPDYFLTNTASKSYGYSGGFGYKSLERGLDVFYSRLQNEIGILRSSHIGNIEDLVIAINSQEPTVIEDFDYTITAPKQDVNHQLLKINLYERFRSFGRLSLQYDFQNNHRLEYDVRVGNDRNKSALDLRLKTHTLSADLKVDSDNTLEYNFGLMGRYQNNFANPDTGVRRLIPDYDKYEFGTYATAVYQLNDKTSIDAGMRYDFVRIDAKKFYQTSRWEERNYQEDFGDLIIEDFGTQILVNPVFNYHNLSASTGLNYAFSDSSEVLFQYALSSRAPNPSELFSDGLHHSAARIELGDLRLQQEVSNRVGGSYNYKSSDFGFNIEAYYNYINDFIYLEPIGIEATIRGAFPVWNYRQNNADFFGIDLSANYSVLENVTLTNNTSFIQANDLDNNRPLIDIPPITIINGLTVSKPKWNDLSLSLKSEWVLEQQNFPDNNFEAYIPTTEENVLVDISSPPPAYHLVHLYSEATFKISKTSELKTSLSVTNLFNTNYRAYLNRLRYFADDVGTNVLLQIQFNY
ncbi:MAG: TonB-dependent receptor [Winogradskyella sp.]|nr:TonB-dependent receptor [Winogradskyella sp.]NNF85676.1 TonB-dependent receptor [Winogradskyella sp.]